MGFRMSIYGFLVNRNIFIKKKYIQIRHKKKGFCGRFYAWIYLLVLNLNYAFGFYKLHTNIFNQDIRKKFEYTSKIQSPYMKRIIELEDCIANENIISFDIFDTLIFRPFSTPSDLFYLVGEKLGYLDFARIRQELEWQARQKKYHECNTYEVTLEEIYNEIEYRTGIPKELGMKLEIETELEFCFGNPFMLELFKLLHEQIKDTNKKIICVTDMYLPQEVISSMLKKAGFHGISKIYLSNELHVSKADGKLYKKVMEEIGTELSYIHIGDNPVSDVKNAQKAGWKAELYSNVNLKGNPYRAEDMSTISGSMYRGIVNARIYNGLKQYTSSYELGYIYGGIFVLGYCQYIYNYVKKNSVDKILFLSRDGDVINKAYNILFADENDTCATEYVYWSRVVATKLSANYFRYDYLRRFIDHKVNQKYTLDQIFCSMEIEDMLKPMCDSFASFIQNYIETKQVKDKSNTAFHLNRKETQIHPATELTDKNAWMIKEYLISRWNEVKEHYVEESLAAKKYFLDVMERKHKVAIVDVGWAGSGAIALDYLFNHDWNIPCEVTGIVAGTNSLNNAEPNMSEQFLYTGKMVSYMFSQENNRDIWKWHNPGKNHNVVVEYLLASTEGSLSRFTLDDTNPQGYGFLFKKPEVKLETSLEIQKGILDFIGDYKKLVPTKYQQQHQISGSDAYAVLRILLQSNLDIELELGI